MAGTSSQNRVLTAKIPLACDREKSYGEHQSHQGQLGAEVQPNLPPAAEIKEPGSWFGQEFVFVNDRGNRDPTFVATFIHAHHFAFAPYPNAFGQSDLRGKSEGKFNVRSSGNCRVHKETYAAGAHIARLRSLFLHSTLGIGHRNGQPQCEAAGCPLIILFGLGHEPSSKACKAWRFA